MAIYVGYRTPYTGEIFRSPNTPERASHGDRYIYVIGPFRTMKGANYLQKYGWNNPHIQHVDDAERLARDVDE